MVRVDFRGGRLAGEAVEECGTATQDGHGDHDEEEGDEVKEDDRGDGGEHRLEQDRHEAAKRDVNVPDGDRRGFVGIHDAGS